MLDLSNSVIMPREDFQELAISAFDRTPTPVGERIAQTVQTSTICFALAGAVGLGSWLWYKAMAKLEDKKLANSITELEEQSRLRSTRQ